MSHTPDSQDTSKVVPITIARKPVANTTDDTSDTAAAEKREPVQTLTVNRQDVKQGGFVLGNEDGAEINLMHSRGGLNALRIFSRIGELKPFYLTQDYFDSIVDED